MTLRFVPTHSTLPRATVIARITLLAGLALGAWATPADAAQKKNDASSKWTVVDGWAVYGHSGNKISSYEWFATRAEADAAKKRMESPPTGPVKSFDKVEIAAEKRKVESGSVTSNKPTTTPRLPVAGGNGRIAPPAPISSPGAPAPSLTGTTWVGQETLQGYNRLEFRFKANNSVEMIDTDGSTMGRWEQTGNQVSLTFYGGNCVYNGTVNGNQLGGNARAGATNFTWSLARK